jgi:hypothetical protein
LASKIFAFLDREPGFLECDKVVFENQPCLVNPVMKSVQMMLYSYFVYHGITRRYGVNNTGDEIIRPLLQVELKSACNKLDQNTVFFEEETAEKVDTKGKAPNAYKARKQKAIAITQHLLTQWNDMDIWRSRFDASTMKEKDDLSDCLLQALTTFQTTNTKNIAVAKKKQKQKQKKK